MIATFQYANATQKPRAAAVAPRGAQVGVRELRARSGSRAARDGLGEEGVLPVGGRCHLRPVGDHQADVGQRVADRAELPVEDGQHAPVLGRRARCRGGSRRGRATARARPAIVPRTALRARRSAGARASSTRATAGPSAAAGAPRGIPAAGGRRGRWRRRRGRATRPASSPSRCPTARARVRVERLCGRDRREDEPVDVLHHVERRAADVGVSQKASVRGTRAPASDSALRTMCSRAMSWAEARISPSGGRRSTTADPRASSSLYVRFD